jgi:hypothetical protein
MHHAEIHLEEAPSRSITSQARLVASMPTNRDAVSRHAAAMKDSPVNGTSSTVFRPMSDS